MTTIILETCNEPAYSQGVFKRGVKNAMDRALACIALLALSLPMALIYVLVSRDGGPAIYGHTRIGKNGKAFKCWKFRTMVPNSNEVLRKLLSENPEARAQWQQDHKLKDDPRITKLGDFLRRSSLDELPQLFNVLKGNMSLVGPRPVVKSERKHYGAQWSDYLSVKPGISGLWQVSGRNDVSYEQRVSLDSQYVRNWSLSLDIMILFKTIFVVLNRRGAY